MKIYIASFFVLYLSLFSIKGQAQETMLFNTSSEQSYFEQLQNYFAQGTLPTQHEIQGYWSGRCYKKADPSEAIGMALVAKNIRVAFSDKNGPLFPSHKPDSTFNMCAVSSSYPAPDQYDHISESDKESLLNYVASEEFKIQQVSEIREGALSTRMTSSTRLAVRKSNGYFFAQISAVDKSGTDAYVAGYCYFFKKILN